MTIRDQARFRYRQQQYANGGLSGLMKQLNAEGFRGGTVREMAKSRTEGKVYTEPAYDRNAYLQGAKAYPGIIMEGMNATGRGDSWKKIVPVDEQAAKHIREMVLEDIKETLIKYGA